MRRKNLVMTALIITITLMLFNTPAYTQTPGTSTRSTDTTGVQFEFQAGLAKFSFDGKFDNGDMAFGIMYYTPKAVVDPGIFLTTNIDLNASNKEEILFMGVLAQVQFRRLLSLGVYYDFWKTGTGLVGWYKPNTGFTVTYNFNF